jgi:mono/diheme cytochrome c family protein
MVFFGNQRPGGVFIDAKPIPGTDEVVLIDSPGHGLREHRGMLAILTVKAGPDQESSLRDLSGPDYTDPYPIGPDLFLAARYREVVLFRRDGREVLLAELPAAWGAATLHEPRPLVARPREPAIPSRTDDQAETGTLVLHDLNRGRSMEGVQRGDIAELLVLESLPKPINFTGGMEPLSYGGTFTLERIVGTVPVAADGSAHFELPANRAYFFVALDREGRSVKRMQSFTSVMPGERTGCVGCHEPRLEAPGNRPGRGGTSLAAARPPTRPAPVPGVPPVIDFPRDVQPVLDRHCVRCHNPEKRSGGVLLSGDRGPVYSHSYFTLSARRLVADGRNLPRSNYPPRGIGDSASPLMAKLDGSHHEVRPPPADLRLLRCWINSGAAWPGTYAALGTGMIGGYASNALDRSDLEWPAVKAAVAVIERRCLPCHNHPERPLPRSPSDDLDMPPWAVDYASPKLRFSRHLLYNLDRPEASLQLLAPLAATAGGYGLCRPDGVAPGQGAVLATIEDPDYRLLLAAIQETAGHLSRIKRFDMPGFRPRPEYVREMVRYGVLPAESANPDATVDPYAAEARYWELVGAPVVGR